MNSGSTSNSNNSGGRDYGASGNRYAGEVWPVSTTGILRALETYAQQCMEGMPEDALWQPTLRYLGVGSLEGDQTQQPPFFSTSTLGRQFVSVPHGDAVAPSSDFGATITQQPASELPEIDEEFANLTLNTSEILILTTSEMRELLSTEAGRLHTGMDPADIDTAPDDGLWGFALVYWGLGSPDVETEEDTQQFGAHPPFLGEPEPQLLQQLYEQQQLQQNEQQLQQNEQLRSFSTSTLSRQFVSVPSGDAVAPASGSGASTQPAPRGDGNGGH